MPLNELQLLAARTTAATMIGETIGLLASDAVHAKHLARCMEKPFIDNEHATVQRLVREATEAVRALSPQEPIETQPLATLKACLRAIIGYLDR